MPYRKAKRDFFQMRQKELYVAEHLFQNVHWIWVPTYLKLKLTISDRSAVLLDMYLSQFRFPMSYIKICYN